MGDPGASVGAAAVIPADDPAAEADGDASAGGSVICGSGKVGAPPLEALVRPPSDMPEAVERRIVWTPSPAAPKPPQGGQEGQEGDAAELEFCRRRLRFLGLGLRRLQAIAFGVPISGDDAQVAITVAAEDVDLHDAILDVERALRIRDARIKELLKSMEPGRTPTEAYEDRLLQARAASPRTASLHLTASTTAHGAADPAPADPAPQSSAEELAIGSAVTIVGSAALSSVTEPENHCAADEQLEQASEAKLSPPPRPCGNIQDDAGVRSPRNDTGSAASAVPQARHACGALSPTSIVPAHMLEYFTTSARAAGTGTSASSTCASRVPVRQTLPAGVMAIALPSRTSARAGVGGAVAGVVDGPGRARSISADVLRTWTQRALSPGTPGMNEAITPRRVVAQPCLSSTPDMAASRGGRSPPASGSLELRVTEGRGAPGEVGGARCGRTQMSPGSACAQPPPQIRSIWQGGGRLQPGFVVPATPPLLSSSRLAGPLLSPRWDASPRTGS